MADIKPFHRGDTRKYRMIIRDKITKEPLSVEGSTLTFTVKAKKKDPDSAAALQVSVTGVDTTPITGEILLIVSKTKSEVTPDDYFYDFQYVSPEGEVTTVLPQDDDTGKVKIKEDITRKNT